MTTDTFRRADHRPVPTSADEAEASPVALRAPSEAPASCCFPLDIAHSPSRRRLSKEIVGRGKGPHSVLLGHGAVFDKESWDHLGRRLAAEGYQALAVDFRGYGKSKAGRSRGGFDEDIIGGIRYLREQGAARVSVIGASMGGGAVGDAVTELGPGEIDGLILLAAVPTRSPERLQGRKLFIVSEGDASRSSVERQFQAAREPKQLTILPGNAHAQHIFRTARGEELTEIILAWIAARP